MKVEATATTIKKEIDLDPILERYEGMSTVLDDRQTQINTLTEEKNAIIKELMNAKAENQNVFFNFKKSEEALKSVQLQLENIRHENAYLQNDLKISQRRESDLTQECHAVRDKLTALRRENSDLRNNLEISQRKGSDLTKEYHIAQEKDKKDQKKILYLIAKNNNLAAQIKQLKSGHRLHNDDRNKKQSSKDENIFDVEKITRHRIRKRKNKLFCTMGEFQQKSKYMGTGRELILYRYLKHI